MDTRQAQFDSHDALVLYAALTAGEKGITSQGIVLLSDCIEHATSSGQEVDKSLERLQTAHHLKFRRGVYLASRYAVADCGPRIAGKPVPAAIEEVLKYLQSQ